MSRSTLVLAVTVALILSATWGCAPERGTRESPASSSNELLYEYQSALEAGDNEKMTELVTSNVQTLPQWIDDQLLIADFTVKGSRGRPVMMSGDVQLTASDLSEVLGSIAEEYEAVSGDAEPLSKVRDWQKKHATEITCAPLGHPEWDVVAFLRAYKDALDRGDHPELEGLVKGDGGVVHGGRVLDLAAYLHHIRPQYEAFRTLDPDSPLALSYGDRFYEPGFTAEDWIRVDDSLAAMVNRCYGQGRDIVSHYSNSKKSEMNSLGGN
ncbi:MAG: hypothetical protein JXA57_21070 [Armatimonadetes bacterium]|nr:hypothetical protein [Armatimonadota bacterium]